jgi:hypothetical protein
MRKLALAIFVVAAACFRCADMGGVENGNPYVAGYVVTADGAPVAGAEVKLTPVNHVPQSTSLDETATCRTNERGYYEIISPIKPELYNIEAVHGGFGGRLDSIDIRGERGQEVGSAVVKAMGSIVGRSFMPGKDDTAQTQVFIYLLGTNQFAIPQLGGGFSFPNVPFGRYQLCFTLVPPPYKPKIMTIDVKPGEEYDLGRVTFYSDSINGLPVVNAGNDTAVTYNDTVRLHGRANDPYGSIDSMAWDIGVTEKFVSTKSGDTALVMNFTRDTTIWCVLRAVDNDGNRVVDSMRIVVSRDALMAYAGADSIVSVNDTIRLHGQGTDRLGTPLIYEWDIGATGNFIRTKSGDTAFKAGPSVDSSFQCVLRVTNSRGKSAVDTVRIAVLRDFPIAFALPKDTAINRYARVTLIGSRSSHLYGGPLSYCWDIGNTGVFVPVKTGDTTITVPDGLFTPFKCVLRVSNDDGDTAWDTTKLTVIQTWRNLVPLSTFGITLSSDLKQYLFVFNNKLWFIFHQGAKDGEMTYKIWNSDDGIAWNKVTDTARFHLDDDFSAIEFNGRLWLTGSYSGALSNFAPQGVVWSTSDGINWKYAADHPAFGARSGHLSAVYDNKIWVIGGKDNGPVVDSAAALKNVWYSEDGLLWQEGARVPETTPVRAVIPSDFGFQVMCAQLGVQETPSLWTFTNGYWNRENGYFSNARFSFINTIAACSYAGQPWIIMNGLPMSMSLSGQQFMWTKTTYFDWVDVSQLSRVDNLGDLTMRTQPVAFKNMIVIGTKNGIRVLK